MNTGKVNPYYCCIFQAHTGNYTATTEEPRRKTRQDDAKPNHVLLFTVINPMYPITVVSDFICVF